MTKDGRPGRRWDCSTRNNVNFTTPNGRAVETGHCCPACYLDNRQLVLASCRVADSTSKPQLLDRRKIIISHSKLFIVNVLLKCIRHHMMSGKKRKMTNRNYPCGDKSDFTLCIPCTSTGMFYGFIYYLMFTQILRKGDKILLRSSSKYMLRLKLEFVLVHYENRHHTWNVLLDVAVACYLVALSNINFINGIKETTSSITSTAVTNTATFGIEHAAQIVGNTAASTAVSAVVDVAISSAMLYMAKRQRDEGIISDKEFTTQIKKTVFKSTLKIAAGATGSIIGQAVIPVPVLGGLVGGFCGSLIGTGIAKGISYGLFDRNEKKQQQEAAKKEEDEEYGIKANLFHRKFRGHIPKITIYNDNTKQFEDKCFKQDVSKYLKHQFMKQDIGLNLHSSGGGGGGGGHGLVDLKEIKSPLPRKKTILKTKNESDENETNFLENNDFYKKWKVKIQSMPTMPKKKQPLLLTNTDQVPYADPEDAPEFISILHVNELAEESFVDASAVIITDKEEQEMLSNSINAGKHSSDAIIEIHPGKTLSLSNITLQNLKEAFTVNKKIKQEKQRDSTDETNKNTGKGLYKEPSIEEEAADNESSEKFTDSKRNFMGNFFQQIKHGTTSFKGLKSMDEVNDNNNKVDESEIKCQQEDDVEEKEDNSDVTYRADGSELDQKHEGLDDTSENDLDGINITEGAVNQQWQRLFKTFKEQRELETEGYKNLIDDTIEIEDDDERNGIEKKALEKIKKKELNDDVYKCSEKKESNVPCTVIYSEKDNVIDSESATENPDDDSVSDERTRKTSFFNYCHNVYDQLERRVSGNTPESITTTKEKQNSSPFSFTKPITTTAEKPSISHRLSNSLSRKEKQSEVRTSEQLDVTPSEVAPEPNKKKSVFDRVKNISKARFSLKS